MKKIFLLLFMLMLLSVLVGCDDSLYTVTYYEPVIVQPDTQTAHTINGYRKHFPTTGSESDYSDATDDSSSTISNKDNDVIYFGNKTTKKFHTQTCRYAKNIDKDKKIVFSSYSDAIEMEYSPCKICQKEE